MASLQSILTRKHGIGAVGAALAMLAGLICLIPRVGDGLANLSFDLAFLARPRVPVTEEAVVVYMDLESHSRLGQNSGLWDRALHARLIDRLTALQARAVVLDQSFAEFTNNPAANAALVEAARRNGRVVVSAVTSPQYLEGELVYEGLEVPFDALGAVTRWGMAVAASSDGYMRREYHLKRWNAPSIAWVAAQVAGFPSNSAPARMLPVPDPFAERWINFYGPPGTLPHLSYWEVLDPNNQTVAGVISNRVVFVGSRIHVGIAGDNSRDVYATPYTRWRGTKSPGVEITATVYVNLIRHDWLQRTTATVELAILLLLGGAVGYGLGKARPIGASLLAVVCAVGFGLAANLAVWQAHVWFPWMFVSAVQVPVGAVWSLLAHSRRLLLEKQALERALALAAARGQEPALAAASTPGVAPRATARPAEGPPGATPAAAGATSPVIPHYTLVRPIGRGAYGEVWLARSIIGSYEAAKIVHRRDFAEAEPYEREFHGIREYTPISRGHPGLVQVLHIGRSEDPEYIYYVMELGDDEKSGQMIDPGTYSPRNLAKELKARGALSVADSVSFGLQLTEALAYLHRHDLIHRDIKPSNIIFVNGVAKLADIGLVTQIAAKGRDVSMMGTEGYMAPEKPGTPAADVFSMGKVIYQAVTGLNVARFPEVPSAIMEETRDDGFRELNQVIMKSCELEPEKRYASAADLHEALAALARRFGRPRS